MKSNFSINCRVCKSTNYKFVFSAKNSDLKSNENFDYSKCSDCDTIFLNKIPNELNKYYSDTYHPFLNNKFFSNFLYLKSYKLYKLVLNKHK